MEADLQQHYGVDLGDLWRGRISLRRVNALVTQLPPDSRTAHAVGGTEDQALAGWKMTDLLLGRLADEMAWFRWQWESSHLDPKKARPRKPPASVLPDLRDSSAAEAPVVSPHQLGTFIYDDDQETA